MTTVSPLVWQGTFSFDLVKHASKMGCSDLLNGRLVRAAQIEFDVMLTVDRNMRHQTSLKGVELGVVVCEVYTNSLTELLPSVARISDAILAVRPGEFLVLDLRS